MAGAKTRREAASSDDEVTMDDLMRMQEARPHKRMRLEEGDVKGAASGSGSGSDSGSGTGSDNEEEEEEEDGSEEEYERDDSPVLPPKDFGTVSRVSALAQKDMPSTNPTPAVSDITWGDMNITASLQMALSSMSIRAPTEIQQACIPPLLSGRDCIGNAKTGSGKTIAFALPILQKLSADPYGIFALVLTPTRELAFQIADQFAVLGGAVSVRTAVIVGGMDVVAQALELGRRPHVVVATPGRLVDLLKSSSGEWDLSRVKFLVLDEADRLLTPTFAPELAYLFGALPRDRQTCLFTATWSDDVERLASASPRPGKQKPFVHRITAAVETVATLSQFYLLVPSHVREAYLFYLLCNPPPSTVPLRRAAPEAKPKGRGKGKKRPKKAADDDDADGALVQPPPTIIFCNKPRGAAYVAALLKTLGIRAAALHSRLPQRERLAALALFRAAVVPVLVSTDVGARGLDIEAVALVVNWDLPHEPEEYTHRVGRTARAGRGGVAVSFVTEHDEERVLAVEKRINTRLAEMALPEDRVLERLNDVSAARRLANMELHDSNFGQREEVHRAKRRG